MRHWIGTGVIGLALLSSGCGGPSDEVVENAENVESAMQPLASKEAMKERLNSIAETGQAGSGLAALYANVEEMKGTDAALADELKKGLDEMQAAGDNPGAVKSIAKRLAGKL